MEYKMEDIKSLERAFTLQMKTRKEELCLQISQYDMEINDLLHHLENYRCDAVSLVKIAKKIKEVRQQRRTAKVEREQVLCLLRTVSESHIEKYERRTKYTYKTKVIDEIFKNNNTK